MNTKAVVFDLYGTLIDDAPPSDYAIYNAEVAQMLGADPARFAELWRANDLMRYTAPIEECFGSICGQLGIVEYGHVLDARRERLRRLLVPRPDALATLAGLRARGLRLGMISNASSELSVVWPESEFHGLFDALLFSADERMMKPDPRLYRRMAELLEVETEECVFVGDGAYRELQGAAAVGMTPVLIRAPYDEHEHQGTIGWEGPRVSALSELLALV